MVIYLNSKLNFVFKEKRFIYFDSPEASPDAVEESTVSPEEQREAIAEDVDTDIDSNLMDLESRQSSSSERQRTSENPPQATENVPADDNDEITDEDVAAIQEATEDSSEETQSIFEKLGEMSETFVNIGEKIKEAFFGVVPPSILAALGIEEGEDSESQDGNAFQQSMDPENEAQMSEGVPGNLVRLANEACNFNNVSTRFAPIILGIMKVESNFNTFDESTRSTASGLGQFLDSTFVSVAEEYGPALVSAGIISRDVLYNADGSINMTAKTNPTVGTYLLLNLTLKDYDFLVREGYATNGLDSHNLGAMLYECHHDGRSGARSSLERNEPMHQFSSRVQAYSENWASLAR